MAKSQAQVDEAMLNCVQSMLIGSNAKVGVRWLMR